MKVPWWRMVFNTIWLWSWNTIHYPDTPARRMRKKVMYRSGGFGDLYWAILLLIVVAVWIIRWLILTLFDIL